MRFVLTKTEAVLIDLFKQEKVGLLFSANEIDNLTQMDLEEDLISTLVLYRKGLIQFSLLEG